MYMCNERLAKVRTGGKLTDELKYTSMPVWMSRVDIMHGMCDQDPLEDLNLFHDCMHGETSRGSQVKQCWLRGLYDSFCAVLMVLERTEQQHLKPRQQSLEHAELVKLVEPLSIDERDNYHM